MMMKLDFKREKQLYQAGGLAAADTISIIQRKRVMKMKLRWVCVCVPAITWKFDLRHDVYNRFGKLVVSLENPLMVKP